jgi:nicotinate-nucleotide adenylyltransferase
MPARNDRVTRRLGVFGGSFDPVHIGHLLIASDICQQLELDAVHFVLAPRPPHKGQLMAADEHRIEMLRRAIAPDHRFVLDLREFERPGPSYSVQTLESFTADRQDAELFFLMGEDSLADFPTWREPERILELARLAVACRPGTDVEPEQIERLFPCAAGRVSMVETPELEISSSLIRARRERGNIIRYLVPTDVERYIIDHRLYVLG